jgi:hypothetical protein
VNYCSSVVAATVTLGVSHRRPDAEDRGWSSTGRILGGQTIGRSGDAGCGLHCAQEDKKCEFLG